MERGEFTPISYSNLLALMVNPDGIIRFVTKPMAHILGYSVDEMVGKNVLRLLIPKIEQGNATKIIREHHAQIKEFGAPFLHKENKPVDLRLQTVSLKNDFLDTHNTVFVSDDIVFGNVIRKILNKPDNNLKELFELSEELIVLFDPKTNLIYANPSWVGKIGPDQNNQETKNLPQFLDQQTKGTLEKAFKKLTSDVDIERVSLSIRSSLNGKIYYLKGYAIVEKKGAKELLYQCIFSDVTEEVRAEKIKNLYYNVSSQIVENVNLPAIYRNIHHELMEAIECTNLYIALYNPDENNGKIIFPYFTDDGGHDRGIVERPVANGITEYAIKKGVPLSIERKEFQKLSKNGSITILGKLPEHWMGVPLTISGRVIGVLAVQSYSPEIKYSKKDLELLDFASSQIALAIEMARTREELQNQTARLNSIFDSSSHLIWSVNKELEVTSFNKNYFEANFVNYDANPTVVEGHSNEEKSFKRFWLEKYKRAFNGEKLQFEIKLKDDNDQDIWKEIHLNPIYTGINKIEEVSGIAHDVTEKKRSELALSKSEEKFRNIFESFQDLYFRCDLHGNLMMVSPSVLELTGYDTTEVIGKHIDDYYLYNPRIKRILKELRSEKNLKNVEVSIVKRNGEVRQCICNVRMVQNTKQEPVEIEGVVRDITQLKITNQQLIEANENAENSLRVKEQFLANMSHEIRTPMNGIIGMIDLLEQSNLDIKQKKHVGTLKKSSSILLEILNDILDLSKIEAGRMELKPVAFSTRQLVDKIHALFSPIAATQRVSLNYHINQSVPEQIIADETRLIQVLSNLVSNSLKFTEKGGSIDIGFEVLQKNKTKVSMRIDVRDSGIGIAKEDQKMLFTSFTQLDNSTTKPYAGTGLGLAISKQLVNLLGGNIGVYSNPGLGSTFWFTFEAKVEKTNIQKAEKKPLQISLENEITGKTFSEAVLVVDDNLINREVAGEILSQYGCKVELANNGKEAIEHVRKKHFDIIFMDIQMPGMDGIEATRKIKKLKKERLPKIVAMTAYAMKEDEEKFLKLGMDDYLPKPIRANDLIEKVSKWTEASKNQNGKKSIVNKNFEDIINYEVLEQLKKYVGQDMLSSVYNEFEEETLEQLSACKKAISNNDWKGIQMLLHTIKGTSGTLGIEKVSEKAKEIESLLKKNSNQSIEKDFSELIDNFVEFQDNFKGIIRNN